MSFSSEVKKELTLVPIGARHCILAELAGLLLTAGKITRDEGCFKIEFYTENAAIARKYFTIVKKAFSMNTEVILKNHTRRKRQTYILRVSDAVITEKILVATTILKYNKDIPLLRAYVDQVFIQSICCKRAYLRGVFLGAGSVSDPEKGYHLELVTQDMEHAVQLKTVMQELEMEAKIVERKGHHVVYLKEGSQIVDLLNIIGAHNALMELENVRIVKEVRNNVNRLVNCETANLKKTVSAAVRQMQDIEYLKSTIGLSSLPKHLEEIAIYRLEYSSATLKELGELLDPPVGKSGVNHRLKKLSEIAEQVREERGGEIND